MKVLDISTELLEGKAMPVYQTLLLSTLLALAVT